MPLAAFSLDMQKGTDSDIWHFSHHAHHVVLNQQLMERYGIKMPSVDLSVFNPDEYQTWAAIHNMMHQQMGATLGYDTRNFNTVDWKDNGSRWNFIQDNRVEHEIAAKKLGVA